MDSAQLQAYLEWKNALPPPAPLGDAYLGGPVTFTPDRDGLFIDSLGTGTADDTAIWNSALRTAEALGIRRIYASRPSYVKNLTITNPIEIIGSPTFELNLTADGTSSNYVLIVRSSHVALRNIIIRMELPDWRDPFHVPAGNAGVVVQATTSFATSTVLENFYFENIRTFGGGRQAGIWFTGGDRITIVNCECNYAYTFGLVLGGSLPIQKCRVLGFRGESCGQYGFTISEFSAATQYTYGDLDVEIRDTVVINCGKFGMLLGAQKYGYDLTTNSLKRMYADIEAHKCGNGGLECKFTLPPPAIVTPAQMKDIYLKIFVTQDSDIGASGVVITSEDTHNPAAAMDRVTLEADVTYTGPAPWIAGLRYSVGDAVVNGSNVYWCLGGPDHAEGLAGNLGAPTGTGTGFASYFDGNLYWHFLNTLTTVPALTFSGVAVTSSGDVNGGGITVKATVYGCNYGVVMYPQKSTDTAIRNLIIRDLVVRNSRAGILDNGDIYDPLTPGLIDNLRILNPDIEASAFGISLGFAAGSVNGGSRVTNSLIQGGRIYVSAGINFARALYLAGDVASLTIAGDPQFTVLANGFFAFGILIAGTVANVDCYDATFHILDQAGEPVWRSSTGTVGVWKNLGNVKFISPSTTNEGYFVSGTTMIGPNIRGIRSSIPVNVAGSIGDTFLIDQETAATGRWVCTTAGAAGVAVWTAKS